MHILYSTLLSWVWGRNLCTGNSLYSYFLANGLKVARLRLLDCTVKSCAYCAMHRRRWGGCVCCTVGAVSCCLSTCGTTMSAAPNSSSSARSETIVENKKIFSKTLKVDKLSASDNNLFFFSHLYGNAHLKFTMIPSPNVGFFKICLYSTYIKICIRN